MKSIIRLFVIVIAYVVPALILFGGCCGLWISGNYMVDAWASSSWPTIKGTVIRSELGSESDFRRSEDDSHYWPEVDFQYEVEGQSFTSNNITLNGLRSGPHIGTGRTEAEEKLALYPIESSIPVYYDPNDPGRSVLETGMTAGNFFVPIFSVVLIALGGGWLWMMFRSPSVGSGDPEAWSDRERTCPECRTRFTSVQDKGSCPKCKHVFYASDIDDNLDVV